MGARRLRALRLLGLALLWGRAAMAEALLATVAPPAPAQVPLVFHQQHLYGLSCEKHSSTVFVMFTLKCSMGSLLDRQDEEEEQLARKREERRLQSLQRKHERKQKHDEIRKKYGLLHESDNPYSRFENE
ncbi:hypothetical protein ASZ78_015191 [Callipepla squamata]|uniref:Uncharacterized protein n=1 Tax=Callipepla squamata TaxID=9009 RepID=A0A226NK82_CALSU|nr:hypothetical protein ASZ78_015191 [Callipepla squamata]